MKRDLPKYVYRIKGVVYFVRRGYDTHRFRYEPGTAEFHVEYAKLLKGVAPAPKGKRWRDLIDSYEKSQRFTGLAPRTQRDYIKVLEFLRARIGDLDPRKMKRKDVIRMRDANAETVRFANYIVQIIRVVMEHAIDLGIRDEGTNPAKGVKLLKSGGEAREPWPDEKVKAFREAYAYETRERLLFELLLGTGQRIGDVLKMQWGQIEDDAITIRQGKTGKKLYLPFTPHLLAALNAAKRRNLTILTSQHGKGAWSYRGAAGAMKSAREAVGAEAYDNHGLRYTAAVELLLAGCDDDTIAAVTGQSPAMVRHYTRHVRQRVRAEEAQKRRK